MPHPRAQATWARVSIWSMWTFAGLAAGFVIGVILGFWIGYEMTRPNQPDSSIQGLAESFSFFVGLIAGIVGGVGGGFAGLLGGLAVGWRFDRRVMGGGNTPPGPQLRQ